MTLRVLAPLSGSVVAMSDVSDPVFAQEIVGPGIAIAPSGEGNVTVVSPVAGRIVKLHPHAFVLVTSDGPGVLVHLGIDTVALNGEGFTLHRAEGDKVEAEEPLITWNPTAIRERGLDPIVPIVIMEATGRTLAPLAEPGSTIIEGAPLLDVA